MKVSPFCNSASPETQHSINTPCDQAIKKISPKNLKDGDLILDVRTIEEVAKKCLAMPFLHEDSATINVSDFIEKHKLDKNKTLNVLCRSGKSALDVAKKFFEEEFPYNISLGA